MNNYKIGDILKVTQGGVIHYERVIQIEPEVLTDDMNPDPTGDISVQGISDAKGFKYEIVTNSNIAYALLNYIPRSIAFSVANRFYGSDYPLPYSAFENAVKELGY